MKYLLFLLLAFVSVAAGPIEPNPIDQKIISFTFNEQYEQAKKLSQEQINLNPDSPKYYYYLINTKILEYYQRVSELDPGKRDEGRKTLNKEIIDYCESVVDKMDESKLNLDNKFYYGTIHAYLARVYGVDASWWSAFKSGKKAKGIMDEIIKTDPQFYDAYLVLGMLGYYADRMSGVTSFIAGILGFSGDREKGLAHLRLAYEKGKLTFGQSALTLIEIYTSLEGNEYAALPYFENFLKQFPNNKRTLNAYCQTLMNVWDFKKVENIIKNDEENLVDDYAKARYYDFRGNSELAIQYGEKALQNERKLFRGGGTAARYIIALNSWLIGDNTRVKKYEHALNERYKEIFTTFKSYEPDSKWLRELSIQIASDKTVPEIENFAGTKPNFKNIKEYEDQYNLLFGALYFKNNLFDKAEQYFNKSINSINERDRFNAIKYLIEIYMRQSVDKSKVKNLLDIIDDLENTRLTYRSKDLEKKYNL
jgi:tetratricopeptide (TPR) repeat protein